ncbi:alpha/beta fold hydrolase [Blastococcus sp. SYSU D00669]
MTALLRRTAAVGTPDGAVLHATVDGPDDAPVTLVLAHGWTLAQAAWDDVADLLAPRAAAGELRLVRYDQRGHGRSTWGAADISIDQLGQDLAAVLDRLVPSGPVVLGGHSMGGMTIMCLAAARPELFGGRVRGAALVSTSAGDLAPEPRTRAERIRQRLTPGALTAALAAARVIERLRQAVPPAHPRHRTIVRDLLYGADATDAMVLAGAEIMHASTVRAFTAFLPALGDHDKRTELAALARVPVEVLVGDTDKLTPLRHSEQLAEALPDARLQVVPRTGHMLPQERPQLVAEAIGRLLAAAVREPAAA